MIINKTIQQQVDSYREMEAYTFFQELTYRKRLTKIISLLMRLDALDERHGLTSMPTRKVYIVP